MVKHITVDCPDCNGTGLMHARDHHHGTWHDSVRSCPTCRCSGQVSFDFDCCDHCGDPCCTGECVEANPANSTATVVWNDGIVDAPGFTTETFARGVAKARGLGFMQMIRTRGGCVRVDTGKSGHVYMVTRQSCDCRGHQSHGHCYHRAAVIWVNDVCGYKIGPDMILGFANGHPVTWAERQHQVRTERFTRRQAAIAA